MKGARGLAVCAALACGVAAATAQEPAERLPLLTREAVDGLYAPPAPLTDEGWLREELDPIARERRALRRAMRERARANAPQGRPPLDAGNVSARGERIRVEIGNRITGNWSPYPDRALDARIIRFPMPRNARADKRTDQQKALDEMRSKK